MGRCLGVKPYCKGNQMTQWTITLEDAGDGSGDLIMPLPQTLLDSAGWDEGDLLEWIDNSDGTWSLKKLNRQMEINF